MTDDNSPDGQPTHDDGSRSDEPFDREDSTEIDGLETAGDESGPTETTGGDDTAPIDGDHSSERTGETAEQTVTYDPADEPLADLADSVGTREDPTSTNQDIEQLFDQHSVSELDSERLWDRLEQDDPSEAPLLEEDRDEREIDAHRYCKQCEHFSSPPEVSCTLEGTDILELSGLGTFRVVDCPVVLEDEALEREY